MKVKKSVSVEEAKKILKKIYEYDRSSAYSPGGMSVSGASITAMFDGNVVEITSGVFTESTLLEFFN